jgi:lipopolysaccharide transport system ATP-binding protein
MSSSIIALKNVSKIYSMTPQFELRRLLGQFIPAAKRRDGTRGRGVRAALQNVSLEIEDGESVGVIGRNGSGKTTLLRLLAGVTLPTAGRIRVQGHVSSMIGLGVGFHGDLTGRENLYLYCSLMGLRTREIEARLDEIAEFAELGEYIDVAFKRYSAGMMARLGFAAALHVDPGVLLLDEVLAVGDHQFHSKSMAALRKVMSECTLIFVSHSMPSVTEICRRAIWLDEGVVRADGPAAAVTAAYLEAQDSAMASRSAAAGQIESAAQ